VFVSKKSSATLLAMGAAGSVKSPQTSEKPETSIVPGKPVKPTKKLLKFPKIQVRKYPTAMRPIGDQPKEGASKVNQKDSLPGPLLESEKEGAHEESEQEGVGECEIDDEKKPETSTVPGKPVKTKKPLKFPKLLVRKYPTAMRPIGDKPKEGASKLKQNESLPGPLLESEKEGAGECEIEVEKCQLHYP